MIALWYVEAGKYKVLPLDSRGTARFADERPQLAEARTTYTYYPDTSAVPENVGVHVLNRAHSITAKLRHAQGRRGRARGAGQRRRRLQPVHPGRQAALRAQLRRRARSSIVESTIDVPEGELELRFEFEPTGKPDIAHGKGTPAQRHSCS